MLRQIIFYEYSVVGPGGLIAGPGFGWVAGELVRIAPWPLWFWESDY